MIGEWCGNNLGYKHLSGVNARCGDDVGTHIIYCKKCKKKNEKLSNSPNLNKEKSDGN